MGRLRPDPPNRPKPMDQIPERKNSIPDNMNATCDLLTTTFTPGIAWEARSPCAISRAVEDNELEKLKARLLRPILNDVASIGADELICRAANEAAALAWETRFPLLVFPTLFEEKAHEALVQMQRQLSVRRRSRQFMSTCRRKSCLIQMRHDWSEINRR